MKNLIQYFHEDKDSYWFSLPGILFKECLQCERVYLIFPKDIIEIKRYKMNMTMFIDVQIPLEKILIYVDGKEDNRLRNNIKQYCDFVDDYISNENGIKEQTF